MYPNSVFLGILLDSARFDRVNGKNTLAVLSQYRQKNRRGICVPRHSGGDGILDGSFDRILNGILDGAFDIIGQIVELDRKSTRLNSSHA